MSSMSTRIPSGSGSPPVQPPAPKPAAKSPLPPAGEGQSEGRRLDGVDAPIVAAPPTGPLRYRAAIQEYMTNEQQVIASQGFTQKPGNRSFALFHNGAPKGLVVMLHGFSAGTEQWSPIAQDLYAQGYDVFVPSLPGHGYVDKDGKDDTSRVPTAKTWKRWDAFEDGIYDLVKSSGHVSAVGLSCGGMLALKMAERHGKDRGPDGQPVIRSVVAASPFLKLTGDYTKVGPIDIKNATVASTLRKVEMGAGEPVDKLLQTQQVDMGADPIPYGFRYTNQDEILGMDDAAVETRKNAKRVGGIPTQIIATAADALADPAAMQEFATHSGARFFEFPASDNVPHAMVNPLENPDPKSYEKVRELILSNVK
jgi:alpha-beta hydrolase superfamily lysophospholipase